MSVDGEGAQEQKLGDNKQQITKICRICGEQKPVSSFLRRTGRRSGAGGTRRGTCRECRKARVLLATDTVVSAKADSRRKLPRLNTPSRNGAEQSSPGLQRTSDQAAKEAALLKTTRKGTVWMRGRTDKGRRWHQEIDLELAITLVKERMAVLVNRSTIKRLYSNRDFRQYILERDRYTCYFCGEPGDTIDHMLPRAKGGHTTPDNCVCACNACNQSKADQDIEIFMKNEEADA
ncbi:HNH endonuclease [Paenibacillus harenae]|uniref:HNH endonuclease n=1 Tax=Paenibacillus harenae TaxID=306543 RepID=UPI0004113894|nr:HNH endonuclease signature motif containing protein [Paenibacillus harenae]